MKRLLTYLSAIVIMMMVPIGAQADTSKWLYLSSEIWGWNVITDNAMFEGDNNAEGNTYTKTISATDVNAHLTNNQFRFRLQACYGSKGNSNDNWEIYPTTNEQELTGSNTISFSEGGNSGNYCYFTPDQDAESYTLTFTYGSTRKIALTINKAVTSTTATLEISGGSTLTSTQTAAPFHFYIPEGSYTKGDNLIFTIKTEQGSTTTYYGNSTTFAEGPKTYTVSSSSSSNTCTYTVPSNATGDITVSLLENLTELVIAHQTSGGGGTSTGYYLVGDLNAFGRPYNDVDWDGKNWGNYGAVNKVLKFMDNGDGTYSLRIPAAHQATSTSEWDKPQNEKDSGVSHEFVIAPESAFSGTEYSGDLYTVGDDNAWKTAWRLSLDWSQVLRPTSNQTLDNAASSGSMAASGSDNWVAKMNGGSYTITINPTAGTWSVTNDNLTHVMYVITKQDGYWRASYLTDVTTSESTAYNHRHGDNTGELSQFSNESGSTVYIAHNWYQVDDSSQQNFNTKEHLTIFGAWSDDGDLAPVTWIAAKSGATAKSKFPTAGNYSTNIDPTTGRTNGVSGTTIYSNQRILSNSNDPATGNITGKKGDEALISPDATLSPETTTYDNYTLNTPVNLTVTMNSYATGYKYSYGASSTPSTAGTSTTFGNLSYDGTNVKLGTDVVASNTNTVTIRIQGTKDTSEGAIHDYTYTFNVSGGSTLDFTPKGGLFINSAKIEVTGGTAPYTYTVKDASDASGKVLSTGNFVLDEDYPDGNYRISTPGYLTVTDANGNSATSNERFDFTYSTSENYKNYNYNATGSKIIQTGGGQGALNVFINKNDDLGTLWLYAYNKTLDTELKAKTGWKQDEVDKQVRLTDAFPGNDMTNAPTITIDGIKYVHFTIPEGNLRTNDKVAIIVSQGNTQAENWWTQTTDAGVEIARTEDPAFIYNVKNVPATTADDSWNYKGANQLYQIAADGSRTIFFTKPAGWTEPIYCHAEDPSKPYCYFVDTDSWGSNLRIWAWDANNGNKNYTDGTWPGATMTQVGDNGASGDSKRYVYRWEYSGNETGKPNKVKFSNKGSNETGTFNFINGAIYNKNGLVKGNEKPTSDKMVLKEGNIYTFSVPVGSTKLYFYDANGNKTSVETYSSSARNHYTWDGSSLISTPASYAVDTEEYNKFLSTPPTTTVVTQRYPNGEDYWRAAPGDLSIKLDPTWGGKSLGDENSVVDWTGTAVPKRINPIQMPLTQTIQGLNAGKTYTVQAIVRGLGQDGKTVTLTLEGATTVSKTLNLRNGSGGSEKVSDLGRQGNEVTKTGRIEYIEPLNLAGMNKHTGEKAGGWAKVEATVNASQAGWLTISLTGNEWFDLSQVTLLEDANTDHGFRTTASTSATDTDLAKVDFRDRSWKKNNAFSFFDRGKNRNAVVFADKRTVIAMDKSLLASECPNRDIDRRHPFNVVATNGASDTNGEASVLYLTDMGYGNDENNPIDHQIGENNADWGAEYNTTDYRKSGYTFKPTLPFTASKVVMDRPIGKETTRQTTIMLPFAISQSELKTYYGNALEVWSYDSYSTAERKIVFTRLTGDLVANTPYILTGAVNPTTGGTAILDSRNNASSNAKIIPAVTSTIYATAEDHSGFTGTYEFQTIERGDATETRYGFNPSTGKFQIASYSGAALKPFRAYFTLPLPYEAQTSAPAYTVVFDDIITGISDTIQVEVEPTDVYTLGGVRVATKGDLSRLPKGVYIVNGKKVIK